MDGKTLVSLFLFILSVSSAALAKQPSRLLGYYGSPAGSSSPTGSSPSVSPPYSSSPGSGSSPVTFGPVASPLSSPIIGSPPSPPIVISPISPTASPVVGSPTSSPIVSSGAPLVTPVVGIPPPPTTGYGGGYGGRGSCGFWSNGGRRWPSLFSEITSLSNAFGGRATSIFGSRMTLIQALLNPNEDGYSALARQGTASLLNAYAFPNFAYTPNQVMERFNEALVDPDLARQQAQMFELANSSV